MPPPSSNREAVARVYFTEGIFILGTMLNSLDEKANKVAMELHPAGVQVVSGKGDRSVIPYARIKSINLA